MPMLLAQMPNVFEGARWLIYPLGLCSLTAAFIIIERLIALRRVQIIPRDLADAIEAGRPLMGGKHTVLARIVDFAETHSNDEAAVKAFARLEVNKMMRGVPYLDVIYAAAPLIGLMGTVTGLLRVFSEIDPQTGLPDPVPFTKGIALALSATVLGLTIAIPSLVGSGYLQRKIENYSAEMEVLLERILRRSRVEPDVDRPEAGRRPEVSRVS